MIFASLLLAASLSAGNAEFDRAATEGAARITMARYADEIRTKGLSEGILKEAMLKNPGGFKSAEEAKEACREYYLAKAKELFASEAGEVFVDEINHLKFTCNVPIPVGSKITIYGIRK